MSLLRQSPDYICFRSTRDKESNATREVGEVVCEQLHELGARLAGSVLVQCVEDNDDRLFQKTRALRGLERLEDQVNEPVAESRGTHVESGRDLFRDFGVPLSQPVCNELGHVMTTRVLALEEDVGSDVMTDFRMASNGLSNRALP